MVPFGKVSACSLKVHWSLVAPDCSSSRHLTLESDECVSLAFGIADCSGMISVINNRGRLPLSESLSVAGGKE